MARKKKPEEHENLERWLVSYGDFITLLFATFVVLYALSQIDMSEFSKLEASIQQAFATKSSLLEGQESILDSSNNSMFDSNSANSAIEALMMEYLSIKYENDSFAQIKEEIDKYTKDNNIDNVTADIDELGLVININNSDIIFPPGQAQLTPAAKKILDQIGASIGQRFVMHMIRVDGYTDNTPVSNPMYPSNWELSTARSCSIVRYLINKFKFYPDIFTAAGYGETRAIADNKTAEGRSKNRRVEIVVLKNKYKKNEKYDDQFLKLEKSEQEKIRREQLLEISKVKGISYDTIKKQNSDTEKSADKNKNALKTKEKYNEEAKKQNEFIPNIIEPIIKRENFVIDIKFKNKEKKNDKKNEQNLPPRKPEQEKAQKEKHTEISKVKGINFDTVKKQKSDTEKQKEKNQNAFKAKEKNNNDTKKQNEYIPNIIEPIIKKENYVIDVK